MSDPLAPPPRRPMPERLQRRIVRDIAEAPTGPARPRTVVIPIAAAALLGAVVVAGGTVLGDRGRAGPVQTAGPHSATASPTPSIRTPTPAPTPRPSKPAAAGLDVRPMTKAEIAADSKACRNDPDNDFPRRGTLRTRYAAVQLRAGIAGPASHEVRMLILTDDAGYLVCENGTRYEGGRGELVEPGAALGAPVVEVENYGWFSRTCRGKTPQVPSSELFTVSEEAVLGRVRFLRGDDAGPWQTTGVRGGFVHFPLRLDGAAVKERSVSIEFQFLDRHGERLAIQPYGEAGTPTTRSFRREYPTCADFPVWRPPKPKVAKPSSDSDGLETCRAMADDSAEADDVSHRGEWTARLVISTQQQWGAVLSDGRHLLGCSLYPTKEISPFSADRGTISKPSFYFATNPIEATGGSSLWAAGRVPSDVSAITYRLPGKRDVAATINEDGYWMVMFHTDGADLAEGNSQDWPPVVVTVNRPSGTQRITIPFSEETSCRQVTHGC